MSASEREQSLRLLDFIHNLRLRGMNEDADSLFYVIPQLVQVKEGVPPERLMVMSVKDAMWLYNKPKDPAGWNTVWGNHVRK